MVIIFIWRLLIIDRSGVAPRFYVGSVLYIISIYPLAGWLHFGRCLGY